MTKLPVTVEVVLFTIRDRRLHLLLTRREGPAHRYALPGGLVREAEPLDVAAARALGGETGAGKVYLEQLYTFGDLPHGSVDRVITVAYYALVPHTHVPRSGTDAAWFPIAELPALGAGHRRIVDYARQRIRNKLDYTNVGFELLPDRFTLTELQLVHEAIAGEPLDKRNFRRKIIQKGIVKPTREWQSTGRKPAQLYRFRQ